MGKNQNRISIYKIEHYRWKLEAWLKWKKWTWDVDQSDGRSWNSAVAEGRSWWKNSKVGRLDRNEEA